MKRISAPVVGLAWAITASAQRAPVAAPSPDIVYEASVSELQAAMTQGRATSAGLVDAYLARISAYDQKAPALNAIIRLNPTARADAAALDAERKSGRVRGPLHGIPILLKDNYATTGFPTSAGTSALAGMQTPDDAFQVRKLRDAGAVILGKTNMHAIGLDATIGGDPADAATRILDGLQLPRFVASLDSTALKGTRLGVLVAHFGTEADDGEVRALLKPRTP